MVDLPIDEDFTPNISFSAKRCLLACVEPDDYVLTVRGSICSDDDREIGRLLGYIIQVNPRSSHSSTVFSPNTFSAGRQHRAIVRTSKRANT